VRKKGWAEIKQLITKQSMIKRLTYVLAACFPFISAAPEYFCQKIMHKS
jgi:hypothetical protein